MRGRLFSLRLGPCLRKSWELTRLTLPLGKAFAAACVLDSTYTVASEPPTPPPTASLPTEAAPPSEPPPVHEIPLKVPAPTLTPNTPRPSWAKVAEIPAKPDTSGGFEDLIMVLSDLYANGNPKPRLSTVTRLLGDRKPDVFEKIDGSQFRTYLQLAESAGIVAVEQHQDGDGWITLCHQRDTGSNSPLQSNGSPQSNGPSHAQPAPSQHAGLRFRDLIQVLNGLRLAEVPEPRFSIVGPRLLQKNPTIYKDAGVTKFKEYVEAAVEAGVITVRGVNGGDGWLKLRPAHNEPPVHPSASAGSSNAPPTHMAGTASPFVPLVKFLESKRSAGFQPVPFSDIFSHFIATIGYPDLVSLYTGVPGVTTFSQYIDAAITSGLASLVSGTTASRDALISLRDAKPSPRVGVRHPLPAKPTTPQYSLFEPLISSLTKLWREGKREPPLSEIHPLVVAQDTMAYIRVGAMTITDYVIKAAAADLVVYDPLPTPGVSLMATTTRLREPPQSSGDPSPPVQLNPSTSLLPSSPHPHEDAVSLRTIKVTPRSFQDLVAVLTKLRTSIGESEPRFSTVVPLLLARRPDAYESVGVSKFTDYVALAMKNGVIGIRWNGRQRRDGWVSLSDPVPGGLKSTSAAS